MNFFIKYEKFTGVIGLILKSALLKEQQISIILMRKNK
jgi:hypothetical protein